MVPEISVPLMASPSTRWQLSENHQSWARELISRTAEEIGSLAPYQELLEQFSNQLIPEEYLHEMQGIAEQVDSNLLETIAANLYYDFVKLILGCTAFAVNSEAGPIHARNMDWCSHNNFLSEYTTVINFTNPDGSTRFKSVAWPGSVGVLSGIAPKRFAVTLNAVLSDEPIQVATSCALMIREVCQQAHDFDEAVERFCSQQLISDCLLLVTGTRENEMVVIERTPSRYAIRKAKKGFIVVTNDYRSFECHALHASGEIYETACGRFETASKFLQESFPSSFNDCFNILNNPNVRMPITVQQMVMCANTGRLEVKTAHR